MLKEKKDEKGKGPDEGKSEGKARRKFLRDAAVGALGVAMLAGTQTLAETEAEANSRVTWAEWFQSNYRLMTDTEKRDAIARLEQRYADEYGKRVIVKDTPPIEGVLFGYALNIQKCIGCRRCVYGCVKENNQSRFDSEIQWIRVIKMDKGHFSPDHRKQEGTFDSTRVGAFSGENMGVALEGEHYYDPPAVPEKGHFYFPIQCMQCENPPCVKVCPSRATYRDKDGVVVIDYNWCIGCRMCVAACPYWARRFNWGEPNLPAEEMNPVTHYLGNRPRMMGVVEKCTFCLQRTRLGRYPACVEACPVGARKFGNLLDPESEVRKILERKKVFRLKAELNTYPKFFYFID